MKRFLKFILVIGAVVLGLVIIDKLPNITKLPNNEQCFAEAFDYNNDNGTTVSENFSTAHSNALTEIDYVYFDFSPIITRSFSQDWGDYIMLYFYLTSPIPDFSDRFVNDGYILLSSTNDYFSYDLCGTFVLKYQAAWLAGGYYRESVNAYCYQLNIVNNSTLYYYGNGLEVSMLSSTEWITSFKGGYSFDCIDNDCFIDMNSNTFFDFSDYISYCTNDCAFYNFISSSTDKPSGSFNLGTAKIRFYYNGNLYSSTCNYVGSFGVTFMSNYSSSTYNKQIKYGNMSFFLYQPVQNVRTSLSIYSYSYDTYLKDCSQVSYTLSRGPDLYNVIYNGALPNYSNMIISNSFVRNNLFDEYIVVNFIHPTTIISYNDLFVFSKGLGFEFNFDMYTEPFVLSESFMEEYDYNPEYKDGTITIVPPNFPVLAWVYNTFVFLAFDMPLISDIIKPIRFVFSMLLSGLNFLIDLPIGTFLYSLLSFFVFFSIFLLIFKGTGLVLSNVGNAFNSYKEKRKANRFNIKQIKKNHKLTQERINFQAKYKSIENNGRSSFKSNLAVKPKKDSN